MCSSNPHNPVLCTCFCFFKLYIKLPCIKNRSQTCCWNVPFKKCVCLRPSPIRFHAIKEILWSWKCGLQCYAPRAEANSCQMHTSQSCTIELMGQTPLGGDLTFRMTCPNSWRLSLWVFYTFDVFIMHATSLPPSFMAHEYSCWQRRGEGWAFKGAGGWSQGFLKLMG